MNHERNNEKFDFDDNISQNETDFPPFQNEKAEDQKYFEVFEKFRFDGDATFTDIDGTLTDNTGEFDERSLASIHKYTELGGVFVPVTGRARFESVAPIMQKTGAEYAVINNGAQIVDKNGNMVFASEIPDEVCQTVFREVEEIGAIWMQNKKDPATGEEYLYSNFTEDSEKALLEVGISDTVHNEERRIGLPAKQATAEEVMSIPGQNYKIQIMSSDPDKIQTLADRFEAQGIPCMLNMQSEKTGRYHWVEVIYGTKISGIQALIDNVLPSEIKTARVVGDGGNDLTMFKPLYNREGQPIPNTYTAVANASNVVKEKAHKILQSSYDQGPRGIGKGGAMVEVFEEETKMREIQTFLDLANKLLDQKILDEQGIMERINMAREKVIQSVHKEPKDPLESYPAA